MLCFVIGLLQISIVEAEVAQWWKACERSWQRLPISMGQFWVLDVNKGQGGRVGSPLLTRMRQEQVLIKSFEGKNKREHDDAISAGLLTAS